MKVDNKSGTTNTTGNVDRLKNSKVSSRSVGGKSGRHETGNVGQSSKVDVSDRAQMMQKAKEIASNNMVDEAKVARLQKMIDEGQYKTDAGAIADKLIDEHMSFPD